MEELFVYALLYSEGFDVWTLYSNTLDKLFIQDPENGDYLALEEMAPKEAVLHTISLMNRSGLHPDYFGKILMRSLQQIYEAVPVEIFARKMYSLWNKLPALVDKEEPFFTLCYADDCLSYGDERQCRQLYESALHYYD